MRRAYVDPAYWDGRTFSAPPPPQPPIRHGDAAVSAAAAPPPPPPPLLSFLGSGAFAMLVRAPAAPAPGEAAGSEGSGRGLAARDATCTVRVARGKDVQ